MEVRRTKGSVFSIGESISYLQQPLCWSEQLASLKAAYNLPRFYSLKDTVYTISYLLLIKRIKYLKNAFFRAKNPELKTLKLRLKRM